MGDNLAIVLTAFIVFGFAFLSLVFYLASKVGK
jgi:hypothetical protein